MFTMIVYLLWQEREKTLQQVEELLNTKVAPGELVDDVKVSEDDKLNIWNLGSYCLFNKWIVFFFF